MVKPKRRQSKTEAAAFASTGGPAIILYNHSGPNDKVHHPENAALVHKRCKELGVVSALYGSRQSGLPELPEGQELHDVVMEFFFKSWQLPFPR